MPKPATSLRPDAAPERRLELIPLSELRGAEENPKEHADAAIGQSIDRFGYVEPIVMDERTGRLVAGHGRLEALRVRQQKGEAPPQGVREEGTQWLVPVLRGWSSRSDAEAKAYLIASNKLTELGGWDDTKLSAMLEELRGQDLIGTGWDESSLNAFLKSLQPPETGATPAEAHATFVEGQVKQIVLYFDGEQYDEVVDRLEAVMQAHPELSSHTAVVLFLLEQHENAND